MTAHAIVLIVVYLFVEQLDTQELPRNIFIGILLVALNAKASCTMMWAMYRAQSFRRLFRQSPFFRSRPAVKIVVVTFFYAFEIDVPMFSRLSHALSPRIVVVDDHFLDQFP